VTKPPTHGFGTPKDSKGSVLIEVMSIQLNACKEHKKHKKAQERLPLLCLLCFLFLSTERLAASVNPNHRCEKTADRSDRVLYNPRRDSLLRPRRFDHSFTWRDDRNVSRPD